MTRSRRPVPVHIVTGQLGAGKTTLIARLLEGERRPGTGLVINEFAEGGIDQLTLGSAGALPATVFGCLCCGPDGDILRALESLVEFGRPDRILIETSGLARADDLVDELLSDRRFHGRFRMGSVVAVADGSLDAASVLVDESQRQINVADLVLLTNLDRIHPPERDQVVSTFAEAVGRINRRTRIVAGDRPSQQLRRLLFAHRGSTSRWSEVLAKARATAGSLHGHMDSVSFTLQGGIRPRDLQPVVSTLCFLVPGIRRFKMLTTSAGGMTALVNITNGRLQGIEMLAEMASSETHVYAIGTSQDLEVLTGYIASQVVETVAAV